MLRNVKKQQNRNCKNDLAVLLIDIILDIKVIVYTDCNVHIYINMYLFMSSVSKGDQT